uniref:Uncharacterized protein n=1 Tax=Oryza barthii TaxID=65489 RepID=A0A0D3GM48_9ORYZ
MLPLYADLGGRNSLICPRTASAAANHGVLPEQQPPRDDGNWLRCVMLSFNADHRGRNTMICSRTTSTAANHG